MKIIKKTLALILVTTFAFIGYESSSNAGGDWKCSGTVRCKKQSGDGWEYCDWSNWTAEGATSEGSAENIMFKECYRSTKSTPQCEKTGSHPLKCSSQNVSHAIE